MAAPCYPADLKDPQFTTEEVAAIWKYARDKYIDHGESFDTTVKGVADDLGLKTKWVAEAFTKPKALRQISNEMYRKMALRREAVKQAKQVVRGLDTPGYARFAQKVWNLPRTVLTWGHYAVFPVTHAGDLAFRPTAWKAYFRGVTNAYKFIGRATHEAAMQELVRDPNYTIARRGGLVNNPEAEPQGILTSMSGASRRGFDALKITRQALFNREWESVPIADRTVDTSRQLSDMINHATGAYTGKVPFSKLQFAPQLTASRWARAVADPVKTLQTFANWRGASAGERIVALKRVRNAAEFAAMYAGLLAVNQGLNQALGSKDKVNFKDPTKSDWLQFKINGHIVGIGSGVREVYGLLGGLIAIGRQTKKERHGDSASEATLKRIGRYLTNKLEPTTGNILEATIGEDRLTGRPLPWSNEKATAKKTRMGYGEYAATHYAPIPLTGGSREAYDSMRERGLSALDATAILKAAEISAAESTGLRFYPTH